MTYLDWLRKFPPPRNFIRDSAPVLAQNIRLDPKDNVERSMQQLHARMRARGAT